MPLYALALAAKPPETFAGKVNDACYLILGKDAANTRVWGSRHAQAFAAPGKTFALMDKAQEALDTAGSAVAAMSRGIFWPPGPGDAWRRDYSSLFMFSPAADLDREWIAVQESRLDAFAEEGRA